MYRVCSLLGVCSPPPSSRNGSLAGFVPSSFLCLVRLPTFSTGSLADLPAGAPLPSLFPLRTLGGMQLFPSQPAHFPPPFIRRFFLFERALQSTPASEFWLSVPPPVSCLFRSLSTRSSPLERWFLHSRRACEVLLLRARCLFPKAKFPSPKMYSPQDERGYCGQTFFVAQNDTRHSFSKELLPSFLPSSGVKEVLLPPYHAVEVTGPRKPFLFWLGSRL